MKIELRHPSDLTCDQTAAWSALQRENPSLASPYFRPEFTQAVARFRPRSSLAVAVMTNAGEPVGFWPFGRTSWNTGIPVGSRLSDFHGVVGCPRMSFDPVELIRAAGISSWRFDHLVPLHTSFNRHAWQHADSPYADLSQGYEAYAATLGSRTQSDLRRKRNRLEREVGRVRFEPNVADLKVLETLIQWKSEQYARTGVADVFAFPWVRQVLAHLLSHQSDDFAVMNSVLYAGEEIVAISYMMRSRNVLHYWFPAYNTAYARYSPGKQLLLDVLRDAPNWGLTRLDFGKGDEEYKRSFASGTTIVAEGAVDRSRFKAGVRRTFHAVRHCLHATPLQTHLQHTGHAIYKLRGRLELQ